MKREILAAQGSDRSRVLTQAVAETARHLGIGGSALGRIIGVSQPVASRILNGGYSLKENDKHWELARLFVRLYRGLHSIVGNNDQLAQQWLQSNNSAFGDRKPSDIIQDVQGLVLACEYVDAHRAPV